MKVLLKSTSVILALLILVLAVPVFAADSYNITAESTQGVFGNVSKSYKAGDEFDLKIYTKADDYLLNGTMYVRFNTDYLYAESATEGTALSAGSPLFRGDGDSEFQETNNYISCIFSAMNGTDFHTESEFITVHFKVKNSFSAAQTISFDVNVLSGIQTPNKPATMLNYIKSGAVVEANKDRFSIRADLTDAPEEPATVAPTTAAPTTAAPTTAAPTTAAPTTAAPTTAAPTTIAPTTVAPTTVAPTTIAPTTVAPVTDPPATVAPATDSPATPAPTEPAVETTAQPVTEKVETTAEVTEDPATEAPTEAVEMYTFLYKPSVEQESKNYNYKLNFNDIYGYSPQNWHLYSFSKAGERLYKVEVPKDYDRVNVLQYQVYDGDTWISQIELSNVNLSDYDNKVIEAVVPVEIETQPDNYTVTAESRQGLFENVSKAYKPGDTFELNIYAQADELLLNGDVKIYFDSSSLKINDMTAGSSLSDFWPSDYNDEELLEQQGYVSCNFTARKGADYRDEKVLITVYFEVKESVSENQTISLDLRTFNGIQNPNKPSTMVNYVKSGAVVESNKDHFSVRAELTDAPEQEITEPDVTSAPGTETYGVETSAQDTSSTQSPATEISDTTEAQTDAPEIYTLLYLPSSQQEDSGYNYRLNLNIPGGSSPEYWKQYKFSPSSETIDGIRLYKVEVPKDYDSVQMLQYQVYDGETWLSQIEISGVKLSDYDNKVIKAVKPVEAETEPPVESGYKITAYSQQGLFKSFTKTYNPGDEFELDIYLRADELLLNGNMYVHFDSEALYAADASAGDNLSTISPLFSGADDEEFQETYGYVACVFSATNGADYGVEDLLIKVSFKVKDTISENQVINLNVTTLTGIQNPRNPNTMVPYIKSGSVVEANKSKFNTRAELVETNIQPVTYETDAPATAEPATVAPTTVAPTTVAPTTVTPTTVAPTTVAPTTVAPTTVVPTTVAPATQAPTQAPETESTPPGMYTLYYLPLLENEAEACNYKLSFKETSAPEGRHQYDFSISSIKVNGLHVYSASVPKTYDSVDLLQYQVYKGDTWISQISFEDTKLSNFDNHIVKADDYTVPETQPQTQGESVYTITAKSPQGLFTNFSESYKPGDEFDFSLYLQANDFILNGDMKIRFNTDALYVESVTAGGNLTSAVTPVTAGAGDSEYQEKNDCVGCNFSATSGADYSVTSVLITAHFKVKDTICENQSVIFDVQTLTGITNPKKPSTMVEYVKSGKMVEKNRERYRVEAELGELPEPVTEAPSTEQPLTEEPTEAPTTEAQTEAPETTAPETEEPSTDLPVTEEVSTVAETEVTQTLSTSSPATEPAKTHALFYLPSADEENAGYNYILSFTDLDGNEVENFHSYSFKITPIESDGVHIYSVNVPQEFDEVQSLRYQVYDGGKWVSQTEFKNVKLSDFAYRIVRSGETDSPEPATQDVTEDFTTGTNSTDETRFVTEPYDTTPFVTEPVNTDSYETNPDNTEPFVTFPDNTEPAPTEVVPTNPYMTDPVSTAPIATQPSSDSSVKNGKKANTIKIKAKKAYKVKAKTLKKKSVKIKIKKLLKITKAKGKVTFFKVKKGTAKKIYKKIKINKKTGKITLKKGKYKKKTYKIKIKVKASGNSAYKSKTVNKVVKIKVK